MIKERLIPYLIIKEVQSNGSEETVEEIPIYDINNAISYEFPNNTSGKDITYNIYYDDGNGCTAQESVIVKGC